MAEAFFLDARSHSTSRHRKYLLRVQILCLTGNLISTWEPLHVLLDAAFVPQELNVGTINQNSSFLLQLNVFVTLEWCEAPVLTDDDLLSAGEFVHRSSQGLDGGGAVAVSSSDGEKNLTNIDTSDGSVGLAPCTPHTSLQSIGTSTGQHLVDSDDMVWVGPDTEMETFLPSDFDKVLIGANASSFKSLRAQLFVFIGNHVNTKRELVDIGTLSSKIEDSNLGIWYTTVESRLWVWLVLAVAIAARRSSGHFDGIWS